MDGRTLDNVGEGLLENGGYVFNLADGAVINNLPGATFECGGSWGMVGNGIFNNAGTFIAEVAPTTFQVPFNNSGSVEVESGELNLQAGGSSAAGTFTVLAGATLGFSGGPVFDAASTISGAGAVTLSGSMTIPGTYNVSGSTTIYVGAQDVVDFSGEVDIDGSTLSVGTLANGGGLVTFHDTPLDVSSITLNYATLTTGPIETADLSIGGWGATLDGSGAVTVTESVLLWGNGTENTLDGRTLDNVGEGLLENGGYVFNLADGGVINNLPGATFKCGGSWGMVGNGIFNNAGTFIAEVAPTTFQVPFNNSGSVEVESGELNLQAGGSSAAGTFTVLAGATLGFSGGPVFDAASTISGAGAVTLSGSMTIPGTYNVSGSTTIYVGAQDVVDFSGAVDIDGSTLSVGTLANGGGLVTFHDTPLDVSSITLNYATLTTGPIETADLSIGGWGATLDGSGEVTVTESVLLWGNGTENTLDGRTLDNVGEGLLENGSYVFNLADGAVINNLPGATFECGGSWGMVGNGIFNNAGTFIAEVAPTTFQVPFNNSGSVEVKSGAVDFETGYTQTGGETRLDGGNIASLTPLDIEAGTLTGSGVVDGSVLIAGQVSPGLATSSPPVGEIQVQGDYSQWSAGALDIGIGGPLATQYDQLDVTGGIALSGALNVSLLGSFTPNLGDQFTIVENNGTQPVSGAFAGLPEGAVFSVGGFWFQISYVGGAGNDVVLTAVSSPTTSLANGSPNPSIYGQEVTFTATVQGVSDEGTVQFLIDGSSFGGPELRSMRTATPYWPRRALTWARTRSPRCTRGVTTRC